MSPVLSMRLNALGLLAISLVLLFAFADQFILGELPCPLCILQRVGFVAVGFGLALNLRFGPKSSHYGIMILSAILGAAVALRQVALHVVPGSGAYGNAFLELHFYTWAFVLFVAIIAGTAVMLLSERQFQDQGTMPARLGGFALAVFALFAVLTLAEGIAVALECGGGLCPDDPTGYQLLNRNPA